VPVETLEAITQITRGEVPVYPGVRALQTSCDRRLEKALARSLGIRTPKFWVIEKNSLACYLEFPLLLKTYCGGYDGKNQRRVANKEELLRAWDEFEQLPCVAEEIIDFKSELSCIIARKADGTWIPYDCFENEHVGGILRTTIWPGAFNRDLRRKAIEASQKIAEKLDVVGLLAVEYFVSKTHEVIFNEIAPRPHNSGHITLDCADTSQFEQQIRAICGLPFGSAARHSAGQMLNIIGNFKDLEEVLNKSNARLHLYGKESRPGRKLGHINFVSVV
jgi:5-(carboxyamino)imidazole ribonucleotide synthase